MFSPLRIFNIQTVETSVRTGFCTQIDRFGTFSRVVPEVFRDHRRASAVNFWTVSGHFSGYFRTCSGSVPGPFLNIFPPFPSIFEDVPSGGGDSKTGSEVQFESADPVDGYEFHLLLVLWHDGTLTPMGGWRSTTSPRILTITSLTHFSQLN